MQSSTLVMPCCVALSVAISPKTLALAKGRERILSVLIFVNLLQEVE